MNRIIVNFTTWPGRDILVPKMLEHFKKQTLTADKIILWLSREEYIEVPKHIKKCLDNKLLSEVRWVDKNSYAHKKEAGMAEFYEDYNILIDDDFYYPYTFVEELMLYSKKHPHNVTVLYGRRRNYDGINVVDKKIVKSDNPSFYNTLQTGWCCFPPKTFPIECFDYNDERDVYAPRCDESWLTAWLLKNDTKVYTIHDWSDFEKHKPGTPEVIDRDFSQSEQLATWKNITRINSDGVRYREQMLCNSFKIANVVNKAHELWPDLDIDKCSNINYHGVSICITAYKATKYIKECLDSVANQTWFEENDDWEILVGVDGCQETYEYLKTIKDDYKNLRILMMNSNAGTYVTTNTLMSNAKYDYLIRFDSDDIMLPHMVSTLMNNINYDMVHFQMINFCENTRESRQARATGQIFMKKSIFLKYGGYRPWRCSADAEFEERTRPFVRNLKLMDVLFNRRIHPASLTQDAKTSNQSDFRKRYADFINTEKNILYTESDAIIKCIVNGFTEIDSPDITPNHIKINTADIYSYKTIFVTPEKPKKLKFGIPDDVEYTEERLKPKHTLVFK